MVIGGEQGNQAEGQAADGLGVTEAIQAWPGAWCWGRFWRNRRLLSGAGWRVVGEAGRGHRISGRRSSAALQAGRPHREVPPAVPWVLVPGGRCPSATMADQELPDDDLEALDQSGSAVKKPVLGQGLGGDEAIDEEVKM